MIHLLLPIAVLLIALGLILPGPAWLKPACFIVSAVLAGMVLMIALIGSPQQRVLNDSGAGAPVVYLV